MSLKIIRTLNSSNPEEEYILLQTEKTINLNGYAITDQSFFDSSGKISNKFRHIYEFPSLIINEGEFIILFSGSGTNKKKEKYTDKRGSVVHPIFWKSQECIWNDSGDKAILIKYEVVETRNVDPIEK